MCRCVRRKSFVFEGFCSVSFICFLFFIFLFFMFDFVHKLYIGLGFGLTPLTTELSETAYFVPFPSTHR